MRKKIIVTGAAGFIGINLVDALLAEDYFVFALVRPNSPHNNRLVAQPNLRIIEMSLENIVEAVQKIDEICDVWLHLAWQGGRDDFEQQEKNVGYALAALSAAKQLGCKRFLGFGSQAEYGTQTKIITEDTLPAPNTAYGAAKVAAFYLLKRRAEQLAIDFLWLRLFSVYGRYEPANTLIPYLIDALKSGQQPQMTAGTQNWEYLYIEDACAAIIKLAESGENGAIYNVTSGTYKPLRDYVEELRHYFAPQGAIRYGSEQRLYVSLQTDVSKLRAIMGNYPKIQFMEGIKKAYS